MRERCDVWTPLYATLFAFAFVGYPFLSAALGAFDAYAREFSIAFRAFVVFGSVAMIWFAMSRMSAAAWRHSALVAFVVLWVLLLARFVWDSSFVPIPLPLAWWDNFLLIVGGVLIPTVALFHAPSERAFDVARRVILCGGVLAAVFLVAAVLRIVREADSLAALARLGTAELNPISVGYVGVTVVIVALLAKMPPNSSSWVARVLDSLAVRATAGMLGAFIAIASASKGPIVALLGVIVLWEVAKIVKAGGGRAWLLAGMRLALALAGMVVLAIFLALFAGVRVVDRFVDVAVDNSTADRTNIWTGALLQFESSPWLGDAFVETAQRYYPHNLFIETLMAVGIPGFCALLFVLIASFRVGLRVLGTRHDWLAILYAQYLSGVMFSGSVYFSSQLWCAGAALFAVDRLLARQSTPQTNTVAPNLVLGGRAG